MFAGRVRIRKVETRAVVHRADGTVEDLGVISVTYGNPFRQALHRLTTKILGDKFGRSSSKPTS